MARQTVMTRVLPTSTVSGSRQLLSLRAFSPLRACWTVDSRATALAAVAAVGCWEVPPAALAAAPDPRPAARAGAEVARRAEGGQALDGEAS
jgi:hypothetical protein